jgi:hypothetical protein
MIGVSQPMVLRMERGLDQRTPRWETLRKIGLALGKQLKLSFVEADGDEPLVEVDGMRPRGATFASERRSSRTRARFATSRRVPSMRSADS